MFVCNLKSQAVCEAVEAFNFYNLKENAHKKNFHSNTLRKKIFTF